MVFIVISSQQVNTALQLNEWHVLHKEKRTVCVCGSQDSNSQPFDHDLVSWNVANREEPGKGRFTWDSETAIKIIKANAKRFDRQWKNYIILGKHSRRDFSLQSSVVSCNFARSLFTSGNYNALCDVVSSTAHGMHALQTTVHKQATFNCQYEGRREDKINWALKPTVKLV